MTSVALAGFSATGYAHETAEADGGVELDFAHGGGSDGHIPANVNYGFELVGTNGLEGTTDGKYTDVWYHNGYAYVGSFQNPDCSRSGAYVVDMADPTNPVMVAEIKSPPGTRYNDVKAHSIGGKDYLFTTSEKCGDLVGNGRAVGGGNGGHQKGQGGINVYNITDATKPHVVKLNMLDFQTHNTFPWTDGANSYLMVVDDENLNDVHIVDITKPQSPKLIATTGIGDWIGTTDVADDGQLFTGVFATPLLHDIWVEQVNGQWQAILSYWDAGFITLDLSDPYNPTYIGDSTYPEVDPVMNVRPMEGNAHAAVFGGEINQYIFGGDEDFDAIQVGITVDNTTSQFIPASQGSDVPQIGPGADVPSLSGATTYVGLACNPIPPAADPTDIAIIQRGDCAFTTKAANAEAADYAGAIVFNHSTDCNASVSMLVEANIPALFVPREFGFDILGIGGYDPATCVGSGTDNGDVLLAGAEGSAGLAIDISGVFDGWGYFHVLNNKNEQVTVPYGMAKDPSSGEYLETRTLGYLGHIGYYAPAEAADPAMASGFGDLTMHNLETDPMQRDRTYVSWYSAGMRALEYRPGHLHTNTGEGSFSWNVHEVGRWIDPQGSNFWGVTVANIGGEQYILASDRNFGLYVFKWECEGRQGDQGNDALYCDPNL